MNPERFEPTLPPEQEDEEQVSEIADALSRGDEEALEEREEKELKPEEKRNLAEAWINMVVDGEELPAGVSDWTNEEMRMWLFKTLMADTARLAEEWDLREDQVLIERIKSEKDTEMRAGLEWDYIESVRRMMREKKRTRPPGKSSKWDSWPKLMREGKDFNCVGGTLLGMTFLERAGIISYFGNPTGHVLNIVKLANGEWVYADFTNDNFKKIEPAEMVLGEARAMKLTEAEKDLVHRYVPLLEKSDVSESILGNIAGAYYEAKNKKATPASRRPAQAIASRFKKEFAANEFDDLAEKLYPAKTSARQSKEMQEEEIRVRAISSVFDSAGKFFNTLSSEQKEMILAEKEVRKESIRRLFVEDDEDVLYNVSREMEKILSLIAKGLKRLKKKDPACYRSCVELFLGD